MKKNLLLLNIIIASSFAFASTKAQIPKEIVSIVQAEQPNLKKTFFELNYGKAEVLKSFPKTKIEKQQGTFVNGTKTLKWWFDKDDKAEYFEIDFGLRSNNLYESEKKLIKNYKSELSSDSLKNLSSATRTQMIKVSNTPASFGVYIPVSHLQSPFIKIVRIEREANAK